MPVYNVESYLRETVESVFNQTLDFKKNCQIIFVNDGSTDESELICREYADKYPENIQYIYQENQGLSAARNVGIVRAEGKYISLLDSDDKLSPDTLRRVLDFFEAHYDEVDFVSIKQVFFEARTGEHPLNYKYETSKVVDIKEDISYVQLSAASSFIKSEVFQKGHMFDPNIRKFSEDTKFLGELVLDKMAYGVVADAVYYYRRRDAGSSITDEARHSKVWYTDIPTSVYLHLFDYSMKKLGYVPRYIQYIAAYDLQWRFLQQTQDVLTREELEAYKKTLYRILREIDDGIILKLPQVHIEHRFFMLGKKYNQSVFEHAKRVGKKYFYNDRLLYDYADDQQAVTFDSLREANGRINLEGRVTGFIFKGVKLKLKYDNKFYDVKSISDADDAVKFLDEVAYDRNRFSVKLKAKNQTTVSSYLFIEDMRPYRLKQSVAGHATAGWTRKKYRIFDRAIFILGDDELLVQTNNLYHRLVRRIKDRS